jgi:lipopolysaccharide/colanic/teichoic acid biosynthesis glycosyltransferase
MTEVRTVRNRAVLRRALDLGVASVALSVFSPVVLLCAVAIRMTSRGPAVFAQERVGLNGCVFRMYKFRTMRNGCDDAAHRDYVRQMLSDAKLSSNGNGQVFKLQGDPRVTMVGRLLRRTSLDELPQLVNVIKGEMAIVGPRPALPYEAELFDQRHQVRFDVRPGITGLWQVSGRARLTMREALDLDVAYVERQCLSLDLQIMARTLPALFSRGGTL